MENTLSTSSILSSSIPTIKPAAIALLANDAAIYDLSLFLASFQVWNLELPPIYLYCSSGVLSYLDKTEPYKGKLITKVVLDRYAKLTRAEMEQMPSTEGLSNLFHDFTEEKCGLVSWALTSLPEDVRLRGVLFCDADIFWLGQMPKIPEGKTLALSQHMIQQRDEDRYGMYNAGLLWTNVLTMPAAWKRACKSSRFFEQAALEVLADSTSEKELYEFGSEVNYGWWRMFQGTKSADVQKAAWSVKKDPEQTYSGLTVYGKPVSCIHTHWKPQDKVSLAFNLWILERLKGLKGQPKVQALLEILSTTTA
jgi:hypothetical protein